MGRMCCECGDIVGDYEWEFEPNLQLCKHGEENYIYIDDWILPTVVLLNKKGYDIVYAITPNMSDPGNKFIIEFEDMMTFNMAEAPDGFYWKDNKTLMSRFVTEQSYDERIKEIASYNMLLYEWAHKLKEKTSDMLN